ncbi:MAG: HAMP domain-containing sensor histidine kinase [Gemmatimonadales bacterium]
MAPRPRRIALSTLLLSGTLALSVALAWLATRAASAQRRSAETALRNYAEIAAWQYARAGRSGLNVALQSSQGLITRAFLQPVRGRVNFFSLNAPAELPGPELMRKQLAADPCECLTSKHASTVFRITPDSVFLVEGDSLAVSTRHQLTATALGDSAAWGRRASRILPAGTPGLADPSRFVVLLRLRLPTPGRRLEGPGMVEPLTAVYGMVIDTIPVQKVLRAAMSDAQVLAPSLLDRMRGSSLVQVNVAAANGQRVFESSPRPDSAFSARDTIGDAFGGLQVTATLDKATAESVLLTGGAGPDAREIAALLLLALGLGAGSLLLLRREQQLVRLRQDFVSGVSHELRTPITQIRLHSELLLQDGFKSEPERRRAMAVVHRESLRMTNLIDNVLRFGRPRESTGAPAPAVTSALGDVARDVCETFQPLAAESGATLTADVRQELDVAGDRDAVTRILCNLVENALKYGPRGQRVKVIIDESSAAGAPTASLIVEDQGEGIPASERDRIWEPYYRLVRDRNAARGGSGLGLAVVADLVGSIGGRSRVEARTGGGSRFIVELPAVIS